MKQGQGSFKTQSEPVDTQIPIAVLVNGATASASEIVSGSMQDLDRAVIIGTRTFGKGLVQTIRPLPYNGTLKVTTSKYYIPSGRCIQAIDYAKRMRTAPLPVFRTALPMFSIQPQDVRCATAEEYVRTLK